MAAKDLVLLPLLNGGGVLIDPEIVGAIRDHSLIPGKSVLLTAGERQQVYPLDVTAAEARDMLLRGE